LLRKFLSSDSRRARPDSGSSSSESAPSADIDSAFATLVQQRASALLITAGSFFFTRADYLIALVARHALPAIYWRREIADAGGLMSYGSSTAELYGQMGVYAGKILNGAKPADLPFM
jgi:ABC-type uncharacterized transport system substrate-binding protein